MHFFLTSAWCRLASHADALRVSSRIPPHEERVTKHKERLREKLGAVEKSTFWLTEALSRAGTRVNFSVSRLIGFRPTTAPQKQARE